MSLALAATIAASAAALPVCSWDRPGQNPFVGDVVAAVDRYTDIPAPVRTDLKKRIAERRYDEIAVIKRDAITGRHKYAPEIREMHFGRGKVCGTVTRAKWSDAAEELGLVYCESGHCILIPTVCRNVSRITRLPDSPATAAESAAPAAPEPAAMSMAEAPADGELIFDPPGAGGTLALAPLGAIEPGGVVPIVPGLPGPGDGGSGFPPLFPLWPSIPDGPAFRPSPLPSVPLPPIPEPSSTLLMLVGLAGLVGLRALRRRFTSERRTGPPPP
jgi:hypothetical protein